ncbi:DUF2087 domain-containing protein [Janibacter melonis]|nr:DUF2087 domain-containing protein [Janibacter melonis]
MAQTGEPYTAALAHIRGHTPGTGCTSAHDEARREQERLVDRQFRGGQLTQIPSKRKTRAAVLLELLPLFEVGRMYLEPEVNEILRRVHADVAYLRRELVNYHYLQRAEGQYRVVVKSPTRPPCQRQEIPEWEAAWLPLFLSGRHTSSVIDWRSLR